MTLLSPLLFCAECTWEIIPMLLGAWLLGFLIWGAINRKRYKQRLEKLQMDREAMENSLAENQRSLDAEVYKHKKLTQRYLDLEKETKSLRLKVREDEG